MAKNLTLLFIFSLLVFGACKKKTGTVIPDPVVIITPTPPPSTDSTEDIIQLSTSFGDMYIWLYKATPLHRANFLKLAKDSFFNGTTFHRIISGFMIQGGDPNTKDSDPTNDGYGGPGYTIPAEIRDTILHDRGALAAARDNNPAKASSGSQFYICHSKSGTTHLNGNYTVFGMVMKGLDVIDKIVVQPKDSKDRPLSDIKMTVKVIRKTLTEIKDEYGYVPKL